MKISWIATLASLLLLPAVAQAAGMAHNENFVVFAPDEALAEEVMAQAEQYRKEIAEQWLGEELPPSVGRVIIHVEVDEDDQGRTWIIDAPDRHYHMVWLNASRERVLGGILRHELTHSVLATELPGRLPAWADEGAASLSDDNERIGIRRKTIAWFKRTSNWPNLQSILDGKTILAKDKATYSVAASLTEYLLTRGDKPLFLKFAADGKAKGWSRALDTHYDIKSVHDLELAWRAWAVRPRR